MQRRLFIRLVGGGTLAAAVPLTAGCSSALPDDAVAAWSGPTAADQADPRRWALAHAILAPNAHNLQSWLVDLAQPNTITLWIDKDRLLPHTDPPGRQVMISQGAFLELLVMALAERGQAADVALFPAGEPGAACTDLPAKPVARVTLRPGGARDPLFAHVLRRHTAKSDYDTTRPVAPDAIAALRTAAATAGVSFGSALDEQPVAAMRKLCWESAQVELLTPRTVMESIHVTRVGPSEINKHRDGISVNNPMARFAATVGLFDRTQPPAPGSEGYKQMMSRFEGHSRSAMAFVWLATERNTRADQIATGRAFVRLQLRASELRLGAHPMSQALQEYPEMAPHYETAHRLTLNRAAPRSTNEPTLQMFCRVGYPLQVPTPAPRRELGAIVRAA